MIAAIVHLTDASRVVLAVLLVFIFLMLIVAAIGMCLERCPERDEDEELGDYYRLRERLPL